MCKLSLAFIFRVSPRCESHSLRPRPKVPSGLRAAKLNTLIQMLYINFQFYSIVYCSRQGSVDKYLTQGISIFKAKVLV